MISLWFPRKIRMEPGDYNSQISNRKKTRKILWTENLWWITVTIKHAHGFQTIQKELYGMSKRNVLFELRQGASITYFMVCLSVGRSELKVFKMSNLYNIFTLVTEWLSFHPLPQHIQSFTHPPTDPCTWDKKNNIRFPLSSWKI